MVGGLWWSFGEPRLENGEIVTDFYFQIGRHIELRFPWPVRRFDGAGGLSLQLDNGTAAGPRLAPDLISNRQETGRKLYDILGKEAQSSLIRSFAHPGADSFERSSTCISRPLSGKQGTLSDLGGSPWNAS